MTRAYLPGQPVNYDQDPRIAMGPDHQVWTGTDAFAELARAVADQDRPVVVVDAYPGADEPGIARALAEHFETVIDVPGRAALPTEQIDALISADLTDDRIFGRITQLRLEDLYDPEAIVALRAEVAGRTGPVALVGWGAWLAAPEPDLCVLADMPRWEIQQRLRGGVSNWRCENPDEDILRKYKRGYFIEWRMADRHKERLYPQLDYFLDTTISVADARLVTAQTFREGLQQATVRPFRVVPFFDPGVWGGQWMREVLGIEGDVPNYAWCFDCVPEENSLALDVQGVRVEMPSINLVLQHPIELMGPLIFARFGADFPIRFDFLDTMDGQNLSLQVHPLTQYIQQEFGMKYTQDESYYMLDVAEGGKVYLGLRTGIDPDAMLTDLDRAQKGEIAFPADEYVNTFDMERHDHVLIPAGTVHCSSRNCMVLEISATSFIFTFKMWDWGRLGMDGRPRPINLAHAARNIQWDRDTEWSRKNLVNRVHEVETGPGYRIETTGLHELEFIQTTRHWFAVPTERDTCSTVHVLNLVQGTAAIVESPTGAFEPYEVHYAETFIVPAAVGRYSIRPAVEGEECATMTAHVRGTELPRSISGQDLRFGGREQ